MFPGRKFLLLVVLCYFLNDCAYLQSDEAFDDSISSTPPYEPNYIAKSTVNTKQVPSTNKPKTKLKDSDDLDTAIRRWKPNAWDYIFDGTLMSIIIGLSTFGLAFNLFLFAYIDHHPELRSNRDILMWNTVSFLRYNSC